MRDQLNGADKILSRVEFVQTVERFHKKSSRNQDTIAEHTK